MVKHISMTNGGLSGPPANASDGGGTQARVAARVLRAAAATVWAFVASGDDG
jgi:hypothetical protein